MNAPHERCGFCGYELHVIWVHGHGQCAQCGVNVAPCCSGDETCPVPGPAGDDD